MNEDIVNWLPSEEYFDSLKEHLSEYLISEVKRVMLDNYDSSGIVNRTGNLRDSIVNAEMTWDPDSGELTIGILYYGFFLNFGTVKIQARPFFPTDEQINELLNEFVTNYTKMYP